MENDQNGVMPTPVQADGSVSPAEEPALQASLSAEAVPFWAAAKAVAKELWHNDPDRPFTDEAWERELCLLGKCGSEPDSVRDNLYASKCFRIAAAALDAANSQARLKSGATQAETQAMDEHDTKTAHHHTHIAGVLRQFTIDFDHSDMLNGEPPRDGISCSILRMAANEIDLLRSEVQEAREIIKSLLTKNALGSADRKARARSFLEEKQSFASCHLPDSADRSVSPSALQSGDGETQ